MMPEGPGTGALVDHCCKTRLLDMQPLLETGDGNCALVVPGLNFPPQPPNLPYSSRPTTGRTRTCLTEFNEKTMT